MTDRVELLPSPDKLSDTLRYTGYTFEGSIADLVDNSIEANASEIDIRLLTDLSGAIFVSISDNGSGMTREELRNAMRYGSDHESERILGRFGFGLNTASTAFAKAFTVTTRTSKGDVASATWDLDIIAQENQWLCLESDEPDLLDIELLDEVAAKTSGTVVRWAKVDRVLTEKQNKSTQKRIDNALEKRATALRKHLGLVFHRFLEGRTPFGDLAITVNGKPVRAWDPFMTGDKRVDRMIDDRTIVHETLAGDFQYRLSAVVVPGNNEIDDTNPEEVFAAGLTGDNQGIYVYRENRLIAGPTWFGLLKDEPHRLMARISIDFGAASDQLFGIGIKKAEIVWEPGALAELKRMAVTPVSVAARKRYDGHTRKAVAKEGVDLHSRANKTLAKEGKAFSQFSVTELDEGKGVASGTNSRGEVSVRIATPTAGTGEHIYVEESLNDGHLWEPVWKGDHMAVALNAGHDFYQRVYAPNQVESVTQAFDYLIWALANAELGVATGRDEEVFDAVKYEVSRALRKLAKALPERREDDEE